MTRYYLYINCGTILDESARFYQVSCGTSRQGRHDLQFLQDYAAQHGHYFAIRTAENEEFFRKCLRSAKSSERDFAPITARQLIRSLKENTCELSQSVMTAAQHIFHMQLSIDYRISHNLAAKTKPSAKRSHVKNLSK